MTATSARARKKHLRDIAADKNNSTRTPINAIWWREPNAFYSRKAKAKLAQSYLTEKERQQRLRIDSWLKTPARKADWMKVFKL